MYQKADGRIRLNVCSLNNEEYIRYLNPSDINISEEYTIEVFAQQLDSPISMLFTESGDMVIAESGFTSGNPRVLRLINDQFVVIAEGFKVPITGINYLKGAIYSCLTQG